MNEAKLALQETVLWALVLLGGAALLVTAPIWSVAWLLRRQKQ